MKRLSQVQEEEDLGSIGVLEDMEIQTLDMILRPEADQEVMADMESTGDMEVIADMEVLG